MKFWCIIDGKCMKSRKKVLFTEQIIRGRRFRSLPLQMRWIQKYIYSTAADQFSLLSSFRRELNKTMPHVLLFLPFSPGLLILIGMPLYMWITWESNMCAIRLIAINVYFIHNSKFVDYDVYESSYLAVGTRECKATNYSRDDVRCRKIRGNKEGKCLQEIFGFMHIYFLIYTSTDQYVQNWYSNGDRPLFYIFLARNHFPNLMLECSWYNSKQ
jgi:hypothetical protein